MCVYVYTQAHTERTAFTGNTKGQYPPAQLCSPWPSVSTAPHSAVRVENSWYAAARSGVSHCLTTRDKTTMVLSGRLEESLDPTLCSLELRGTKTSLLQDHCCLQNTAFASCCHRHSLPLGRKISIFDCLGVFCCFSFNIL